ncbi:MAG: glycosyltransferase family 4 protein [Planctomycetota bacterium]|jgi:glycosyltransferase involved in cell wall biosynthesis
MKIGFNFHSADDYISGVEYYSLGLLRSLLDIDRQNQYIVFTNRPSLINSFIGSKDNLIVRNCSFLKNRLHRILWEHSRLARLAKKENLDILHCPHYICPTVKSSAAYVVTIHDTIAIDHPDWCKKSNAAYYRLFLEKSAKTASKIVAVSKFTVEKINKNFGVENSKIEVIHPGIDTGIFNLCQDTERQDQVRIKYNLPENYILYSGNIEPKKNILNLLKVFKLLRNNGAKHSLVISGQRNWKSKNIFDFLCTEFGPDEVILTGYIDRADIGYVYKMADCLLLPSFCEGFGFPALEAFACGVPVAASCVGILQEINKNSYTHLEPDDPEQMAESINRLLTDYRLREMQIKTALTQVQKFNWSDCAAKTLALYREVCQANG